MAMSVFVRQEKITFRMGLQSDPIDLTKTRLYLTVAHGPTKEDEKVRGNAFIVEGQGFDKSNEPI